jgi:hypothetical protein
MSLFFEDIESEKYLQQCAEEELAEIDHYLNDMQTGAADGEMDITWQETGRGYYRHLHELQDLEGEAKEQYRKRLEKDIEAWLSKKSSSAEHMVQKVKKQLADY